MARTIHVGFQDIVDEKKKKDKLKADVVERFRATLVEVDGSVKANGRPLHVNYIGYNSGQPGVARCRLVLAGKLTPVWVERRDGEALPTVIDIDWDRIQSSGGEEPKTALIGGHGPDHDWLGRDNMPIDPRSLKPLMVRPAGGLTVDVLSGRYGHDYQEFYFPGEFDYDLSSYQPTPGGAAMKLGAGLYLSDNELQVVIGQPIAKSHFPLPELAFAWPEGIFKLAVVILYSDKDFVDKEDVKKPIVLWGYVEDDYPNAIAALHYFENCW